MEWASCIVSTTRPFLRRKNFASSSRRFNTTTTIVPSGFRTASVFRQALELVQYGSEGEIFIQSLQWVNWIQKAWAFFTDHWRLMQGLAALVSLPLSYLCVRSTPQP